MKLQVQIKPVLVPICKKSHTNQIQINHTVAFLMAVSISNVVNVSNGLSDSRARANVS